MTTTPWGVAETQLRDPGSVLSLSAAALPWDRRTVEATVTGPFWEVLAGLDVTLLVTREYEHLVLALTCTADGPATSVLRVPHPSGLVVDRARGRVHIACTRNPNQVMELAPAPGWLARTDRARTGGEPGLVPVATRFYPGCFYLHDLALVSGRLLGNAVGMNAVVALDAADVAPVWWPRSIESADGPDLSQNLIQLNSIAAAATVEDSFFTASSVTAGAHAARRSRLGRRGPRRRLLRAHPPAGRARPDPTPLGPVRHRRAVVGGRQRLRLAQRRRR